MSDMYIIRRLCSTIGETTAERSSPPARLEVFLVFQVAVQGGRRLSFGPQGGIVSPILANVYLHYVLDVWFDEVVKAHCKGSAYLCRYADDFVCVFELESDARRFYEALPKRLAKFGLEVAADKTKILQFDRNSKQRFEFLGFEFYRGKGRQGYNVLKRRTSRKKYKAALGHL